MVEGSERRAVLGFEAVAGEGEDAESEGHRELAQVGLKLGVGGCCADSGLLEFDDADRHAVHVEDDVESTVHFSVTGCRLTDGDLIHCEPVVLRRVGAE